MSELIQADQFKSILQLKIPLLDVRAPMEFNKGAFPCASNLPLLNDMQRQAVGTCYRQRGRQAAIDLGTRLLGIEGKALCVKNWKLAIQQHPDTALYCFRGGLRSKTAQEWLREEGISVRRVAGGYKALRRFLIQQVELLASADNLIIIAGKTGSGKTHLLRTLPNSLDLEGIACHRGSAFGRRVIDQPGQIDFENRLAIQLLDLHWQQQQRVVVEDESRSIGSLSIPLPLYRRMHESPLALLDVPLQERVNTIHHDYIQSNYADFHRLHSNQANQLFADSLLEALGRIRRRLGEERFMHIKGIMQSALEQQQRAGDTDAHRYWIEELLTSYYDPMYEYQLESKLQRVVYKGTAEELTSWIQPKVLLQHT